MLNIFELRAKYTLLRKCTYNKSSYKMRICYGPDKDKNLFQGLTPENLYLPYPA